MKPVIKKKVNVIDEITKSAEKAAMKIENQNKLWDRLCKEFAHLNDDNRKARELFDFIIRLI